MAIVDSIRRGEPILGFDPSKVDLQTLDEVWVRFEHGLVQERLESLKDTDIGSYSQIVDISNRSIDELENNVVARILNSDQARAADLVRSQLSGKSWDFANQNHRVMMGHAMTQIMRKELGLQ